MADVKPVEEQVTLPPKRKPDSSKPVNQITEPEKPEEQQEGADSRKKQKVEISRNGVVSAAEDVKTGEIAAPPNEEAAAEDDEDDEEDYQAEEEEDEEEEDDDQEPSNEVVDRKGKGIMVDDKGKGKMVMESDEDDDDVSDEDDDSSSSDDEFSDGLDSDLEDDPLAEVDLDNILPSRTRKSGPQPGLWIGGDQGKDGKA